MNKSEFERMISLVDEKYVDEMLEEKIYGKRKNIFLSLGAVAAALTLTVGGISYFVSTAGNDDIAVTDPVVMIDDLTDTEVTNVTATVVPIDYEDFFRNKSDEYPISFYCNWDNEFGNDSQNTFDIDYVKSIIPFSAEGYSDSRNQAYAYCDGNNEPFGVSMYFESEFDETASPKFKSINIYICTAGKLSHTFPLEEAEPVNCFGTDIYGFDDTDNYYSGAYDRRLKAYFAADGIEYAIETSNLSCEETVNIIRDIIQSGFSIKDFDLTAGSDFDYEVTDISLEEANMIEPFAGYIPQVNNVFSLYNKGPHYDVVKINGEIYCQTLSFAYTDGTNSDDGKRVGFEYYTRSTGRGAKPFDDTINLSEISLEKLNDFAAGDEYKFTINCYSFMINVNAKCTVNELWTYIENIKGDTYKNTITLAEASASTPFAEYLPKTDKIGDLVIGNIFFEKEKNWENPTLTLDYSSQDRRGTFSYYGIVYHMDQQQVLEKVVSLNNITKADIEKLSAKSSGIGNNKNFDFSIDCGGIWIDVHGDCTVDEIWAFIENIKSDSEQVGVRMSNGIRLFDSTLSEANKIKPFEGYIPQSESFGSLKLSAVSKGSFDGDHSPRLIHLVYVDDLDDPKQMLTAHFYSDYKAVFLDEPKYSAVPLADITPEEVIPGKSLVVDCGEFEILIGPSHECSKEDIWRFINGVKSLTTYDAGDEQRIAEEIRILEEQERKRAEEEAQKRRQAEASATESGNTKEIITISKLKELANKGDDLMWSDFDGYDFTDVGSGLYIRCYGVEGGYTLTVGGGSLDEKPMYVYLDSKTKRMDFRYESIDEFLN